MVIYDKVLECSPGEVEVTVHAKEPLVSLSAGEPGTSYGWASLTVQEVRRLILLLETAVAAIEVR